jgi:Carboxypeptidase regulatory-like domain
MRHADRGGLGTWMLGCLAVVLLCASLAHAQSAGTGAITGTVTDPSGAAVANAKVMLTSLATNQIRTATTGARGDYKFSLLPPGNYKVEFSAPGFKTATVASVTVNVTETETVNQALEVGAITQTVTVESNAQLLQTESSTLGTTVSGSQIASLPLANRNYTEILGLSAGTSADVGNATSVGKGTADISANGVDPGSNNFEMDGVAVDNIANSGSANDGTIYTGIPIPSPDAIQEFKVQTSTYDASYGRNPGANVVVSTKSGTNKFHGTAFEFLRNSVLNADDFFYNKTPGHPHQVLDQNQFGATLGGPVKKDKLFFFFSYQGTRAKNAVGPQGKTFGALLGGINPESRGTCGPPLAVPDNTPNSTISNLCDAQAQQFATDMGIANTNVVGLRIMQLQGGAKTSDGSPSYYIPNPGSVTQFCNGATGVCNFSIPAIYTENQYVANGDWVINSKETLSTKYFYTHNPWTSALGEMGGDLPGTPESILFGNHNAVLKLTSLLTNNFVNDARVSFQQNVNAATVTMPPGGSPDALGMQPLVPGFFEPFGTVNVATGYGMFGGLLPDKGPTNQLQAADQISWSHGRHNIRAGYEYEWTNWPLSDQGLQQGLMLIFGYSSFLGAGTNTGGPPWNVGCLFCVKGPSGGGGIVHFYQLDNQNAYVLDDWKVSSRLTLNLGLRWEYDGLLSDKYGHLTQVWINRMVANADVPTSEAAALTSSLGVQQYVVPSNFSTSYPQGPPAGVGFATNRNSVEGHAPYSNFAPRFGFAWQPLSDRKLVVRAGVGIFYDRIGLDRTVHAFEQGYPYAATYDFSFGSTRWAQSTLASPYPGIALVCLPSDPTCNAPGDPGLGFAPRFSDFATGVDSSLNTPYLPVSVHTPLVREYSAGIQYEFARGWVLDLGYVGSSGINLTDYNHNHNQALLATPTNSLGSFCSGGTPNICNTAGNAAWRVPYVGYEAGGLQASDFNGYSNYNSLQITVRHELSHGLSMQAAYTWSRNLSDVFVANTANINDALDVKSQYGRVWFDRPQRLIVNYSYDLPLGESTTGALSKAVKGWSVSGVTIAQSGAPLTFIAPGVAGTAYGTSGSSILQGVATAQFCPSMGNGNIKSSGGTEANLSHYFNTGAFIGASGVCAPAPVPFGDSTATGYGNSGVGIALGPGQFNWDVSIAKDTQITERVRVQFRADFYNAFNHPQFCPPGGGAGGSYGGCFAFGLNSLEDVTTLASTGNTIRNTDVNPRLIQFGLHFFF